MRAVCTFVPPLAGIEAMTRASTTATAANTMGDQVGWFFHRPRPDRFVHLIGLFGQKNK